jgi:2-polyprenyl-3-methyl-5-hydroxy-6-metoxy-1,4-benzoquinol methylase
MYELKVHKDSSISEDRRQEVLEFYRISDDHLKKYQLQHGDFGSDRFRSRYMSPFSGDLESGEKLMSAYKSADFDYALRLMLGYQRYGTVYPYLDYLLKRVDCGRATALSKYNVLDYGSGVGDTALVFKTLGFNVTLVDLKTKRAEFTKWRLSKRGYDARTIELDDPNTIPDFSESFTVILAIEVLEHVPRPIHLLDVFIKKLDDENGYLITTLPKNFTHTVGGDHLLQSVKEIGSQEFKEMFLENFVNVQCRDFSRNSFLYKRIGKRLTVEAMPRSLQGDKDGQR